MNSKSTRLFLIAILSLSAFLRLYQLDDIPTGLFFDECSGGYDAWSIIRTGADQWGTTYPLYFRSWGDYKAGLYRYSIIPFIYLIGLNAWAVRLAGAIYGILAVLLTYLIGRRWFEERVGLLAAFFLATCPWHLVVGRCGMRMISGATVFMLSLHLLLKAIKDKPSWLPAAGFCFGISFYTYSAFRPFVPVMLLIILIAYRRFFSEHLQLSILSTLTFLVASAPMLYFTIKHPEWFMARFEMISIFKVADSNVAAMWLFIKNLLAFYSPKFLFFQANLNMQFHFEHYGELHRYLIPVIGFGWYMLLKHRTSKSWIMVIWFLAYPIAGSVVTETIPNVIRGVTIFPLMSLVAAFGTVELTKKLKQGNWSQYKWIASVWVVLGILETGLFLHHYFLVWPLLPNTHQSWQYGWEEVIAYTEKVKDDYQEIVMTKYSKCPYIITLFFSRTPPEFYQAHYGVLGPEVGFKYRFFPQGSSLLQYAMETDKKGLYCLRKFELPELKPLHVVWFPSGDAAFKICEIDPKRRPMLQIEEAY